MKSPIAPKKPTGFIVACLVLAALAFAFAFFVGMSGNPKDRVGLAGFPVGLVLIGFAFWAHRRARSGPVGMRVGPLYTLLETAQPIERLGEWWSRNSGGYREVVGFTSLGSVFLRDPDTSTYVVLWPLRAGRNASTLEKCASVEEFEARFLKDRDHAPVILDPIKVAALRREHGPLEPGQVYIPVPYPMIAAISGQAGPPTYEKGDFWVFIDLCGQLTGKFS